MRPDHYATLRVDPDADLSVIKSAYRYEAKRTHPDAGGKPGEFEAVGAAWLVLRDPEKRARYDRGENEPVDDRFAKVSQMLCSLFAQCLDQCDIDHTDLTTVVRTNLNEMKCTNASTVRKLEAAIVKVEKVLKRLAYTGARGDIVGVMVSGAIEQHRKGLAACAEEASQIAEALVYLDDYKYAADPAPPVTTTAGLWSSTSW